MSDEITRLLSVVLTDDELRAESESLARAIQEHAALQTEKQNVAAQFSSKLKTVNKAIGELADAVKTGKKNRLIPCREYFDYERFVVTLIRRDTGETVESRSMTEKERQRQFGFKTGDKAATASVAGD